MHAHIPPFAFDPTAAAADDDDALSCVHLFHTSPLAVSHEPTRTILKDSPGSIAVLLFSKNPTGRPLLNQQVREGTKKVEFSLPTTSHYSRERSLLLPLLGIESLKVLVCVIGRMGLPGCSERQKRIG